MDNIFPELFIPGESLASGDIVNPWSKYCIDSPAKASLNFSNLKLTFLFPPSTSVDDCD